MLGCLLVVMSFLLSSVAHCATILLQSGEEVNGKILDQTPLQVTVDVHGTAETYYLGEIVSINGEKVEVPQADIQPEEALAAERAKEAAVLKSAAAVPRAGNAIAIKAESHPVKRAVPATPAPAAPAMEPTPESPDSDKLESLVRRIHEMTGKTLEMNKNVVPTPDGGLIIVGPDKITKYDKDLNIIKEVDLNK